MLNMVMVTVAAGVVLFGTFFLLWNTRSFREWAAEHMSWGLRGVLQLRYYHYITPHLEFAECLLEKWLWLSMGSQEREAWAARCYVLRQQYTALRHLGWGEQRYELSKLEELRIEAERLCATVKQYASRGYIHDYLSEDFADYVARVQEQADLGGRLHYIASTLDIRGGLYGLFDDSMSVQLKLAVG